jgi:hypothetical protein
MGFWEARSMVGPQRAAGVVIAQVALAYCSIRLMPYFAVLSFCLYCEVRCVVAV